MTHRRQLQRIFRIDGPLDPPHQLEQHHFHLQHRVPLAETFPRVAVERDAVPTHRFAPEFRQDRVGVGAPSFGDELARGGSPYLLVALHARRVPSDNCALGDRDGAAKKGVLESDPVDQLGDGRVDT